MHNISTTKWQHDHIFGMDEVKSGEKNTLFVIVITVTMMLVEIVAGIIFGSMALLADGMHMGSHAVALTISAGAYVYARKYANDDRFSFGTGKVNALAGFTSAILLVVFALSIAWESLGRFVHPIKIGFNQALLVAGVGLVVNSISASILKEKHRHSHDFVHDHDHPHSSIGHSDQNLRSAYLHVLADALTSVFAIIALLGGKYLGLVWMDPLMGVVGAVMVARWSASLIQETSQILLDHKGPEKIQKTIIDAIESRDENRVCDFHLWSVGPDIFAAAISVVTASPKPPDDYKKIIPNNIGLVHATVEVYPCEKI